MRFWAWSNVEWIRRLAEGNGGEKMGSPAGGLFSCDKLQNSLEWGHM